MLDRLGKSRVAMIVVSLVSVLLIVAGVFVALVYHDNGDGQTGTYIAIFLGFVATIVTNIVALAKAHLLQDGVNEIKANTANTPDEIPETEEEETS